MSAVNWIKIVLSILKIAEEAQKAAARSSEETVESQIKKLKNA